MSGAFAFELVHRVYGRRVVIAPATFEKQILARTWRLERGNRRASERELQGTSHTPVAVVKVVGQSRRLYAAADETTVTRRREMVE